MFIAKLKYITYLRLKRVYVFNTWLKEMEDLKFVSVGF